MDGLQGGEEEGRWVHFELDGVIDVFGAAAAAVRRVAMLVVAARTIALTTVIATALRIASRVRAFVFVVSGHTSS